MKQLLLAITFIASVCFANEQENVKIIQTQNAKILKLHRKIARQNIIIMVFAAGIGTVLWIKANEVKNGITAFEQLRTDLTQAFNAVVNWWNEEDPITKTFSAPQLVTIKTQIHTPEVQQESTSSLDSATTSTVTGDVTTTLDDQNK